MNTGIISYDNSTGPDPTSTQWPNAQSKECKDEPLLNIQPIVPWSPPGPSNSDVAENQGRIDDASDERIEPLEKVERIVAEDLAQHNYGYVDCRIDSHTNDRTSSTSK